MLYRPYRGVEPARSPARPMRIKGIEPMIRITLIAVDALATIATESPGPSVVASSKRLPLSQRSPPRAPPWPKPQRPYAHWSRPQLRQARTSQSSGRRRPAPTRAAQRSRSNALTPGLPHLVGKRTWLANAGVSLPQCGRGLKTPQRHKTAVTLRHYAAPSIQSPFTGRCLVPI